MQPKLYHTDVFMPSSIAASAARLSYLNLSWTKHAVRELTSDKYRDAKIPTDFFDGAFHGEDWQLIEVEVLGGKPTKFVLRRPVDTLHSIVLVIRPSFASEAHVITCWINLNTDNHKTLDRTKYENS